MEIITQHKIRSRCWQSYHHGWQGDDGHLVECHLSRNCGRIRQLERGSFNKTILAMIPRARNLSLLQEGLYANCSSDAYSQPLRSGSAVQIAVPFMVVIIICNGLKAIAVYCTLKESSTPLLVTQGDAVASFLDQPDMATLGYCSTLEKSAIIQALNQPECEKLRP